MRHFRNIVITGASSGIGEALARDYAAPGVALALNGRDSARLETVAAACRASGARIEARALDVTDHEQMAAWLTAFDDAFPVDLIVASAGISPDVDNTRLADVQLAHWTTAVNVGGVFNTVLPLLPRLVARGHGQIAVISSLAGFIGLPYAATYSATKAAVRVWGEGLRHELDSRGVGVTVVCPGFVMSRMTAHWPYFTPLLMPAARASRLIRHGIARNRPRVAFPFLLRAALWIAGFLPVGVSQFLVRIFPR